MDYAELMKQQKDEARKNAEAMAEKHAVWVKTAVESFIKDHKKKLDLCVAEALERIENAKEAEWRMTLMYGPNLTEDDWFIKEGACEYIHKKIWEVLAGKRYYIRISTWHGRFTMSVVDYDALDRLHAPIRARWAAEDAVRNARYVARKQEMEEIRTWIKTHPWLAFFCCVSSL
jgi:hypothetical protein